MSKGNISLLTLTVIASATVAANRFVTTAGAHGGPGALPLGVTRSEGVSGDPIPVDVLGTAVVEAGDAIAADATIMVTTDGKALTHDGDGDKHAAGRALEAAGAAGALVEILLVPSSGLIVAAAAVP